MKYLTFLMILLVFATDSSGADIVASASRTSGVAPLSVHFNADLTASNSSKQDFHNYQYTWNFGDAASGNWGPDGESKNTAYGAVAVHVFETAGTYNVKLTVRDSSNGSVIPSLAKSFKVTVTDADTFYSGSKTTCVSDTTSFTGCPSGANRVTSKDLVSSLPQYMDAGERVLLRRGGNWAVSSRPDFRSSNGPVTLGAFGTCTNPDVYGICSNAPNINISGGITFLSPNNKRDWRLMDITFENAARDSMVVQGLTNVKQWLISRIKTTGFNTIVSIGTYRYNDVDYNEQFHLYSSKFQNIGYYGMYGASEKTAITGCYMDRSYNQHIVRIKLGYLGVIAHNALSGAGGSTHVLKLHSPEHDLVGKHSETGPDGTRNESRFWVISDNLIGGSGVYSVSIGPENQVKNQHPKDILFERNWVASEYGSKPGVASVALEVCAQYVTVRNNIFDATGGRVGWDGINVHVKGVSPSPDRVAIYNNTFYGKNSGSASREAIVIQSSAKNTTVRNNYVSFPGSTGTKRLIKNSSGSTIQSNNVMVDVANLKDPDNSIVTKRDFSLTSSTTAAIDKGTHTPLLKTFNSTFRTGIYDIGAYEYDSLEDSTSDVPLTSTIPSIPNDFQIN